MPLAIQDFNWPGCTFLVSRAWAVMNPKAKKSWHPHYQLLLVWTQVSYTSTVTAIFMLISNYREGISWTTMIVSCFSCGVAQMRFKDDESMCVFTSTYCTWHPLLSVMHAHSCLAVDFCAYAHIPILSLPVLETNIIIMIVPWTVLCDWSLDQRWPCYSLWQQPQNHP